MIEFIESPLFDNWFVNHKPEKSLLVCSPYIKEAALKEVFSVYDDIITKENFDFTLLFRGTNYDFTHGSIDVNLLNYFLETKGFNIEKIRRSQNLHMKAYLVDEKYLLIGSGNLTNSGIFVKTQTENFEGAIATDDLETIRQFEQYFNYIWVQSELFDDFYDDIISAYGKYVKHYSDNEAYERIKRHKATFKQKTKTNKVKTASKNTNTIQSNNTTYTLDDIPPVGDISYVEYVLKALSDNPNGLSYKDLGRITRIMSDLDENAKDGALLKFGEEKGKYTAFLGFANTSQIDNLKGFKINKLGELFLKLDEQQKINCLKERILSIEIICDILALCDEPGFSTRDYLLETCEGATPSTLSRKIGPINELVDFVKQNCTSEELQKVLESI